jgi:hypothetical protein
LINESFSELYLQQELGTSVKIHMNKQRLILLLVLVALGFQSCGLGKKKCDCPDLRRSKRVASFFDPEYRNFSVEIRAIV